MSTLIVAEVKAHSPFGWVSSYFIATIKDINPSADAALIGTNLPSLSKL